MQVADIFRHIGFLGQVFENNPKSEWQIETFAVLPSKNEPRWIIPLKNRNLIISSLAIYQPSLMRAKIFKQLAILAASLGFLKFFVKSKIYFRKTGKEVKKIFNRDRLHYAIFTGSEGSHRKITIQAMDEEGAILGYIKVSHNEEIDSILENEAQVLDGLLRLDVRNGLFPRVIFWGSINGTNVLVLDSHKSFDSKFSSMLSNIHIDFLTELFQKTSSVKKYKESFFALNLKRRLETLKSKVFGNHEIERNWGFNMDKLKQGYNRALDFVKEEIDNIELPFGMSHRDFTPWNTFFHNGKLYVFDWEYARKDYPPLIDLFHFIVQDGILVRHLKPEGLLKRISRNYKLIEKYCDSVDIDKNLLNSLFLCYLLDINLFYLEREKGEVNKKITKMLETRNKMIGLVIEERIHIL